MRLFHTILAVVISASLVNIGGVTVVRMAEAKSGAHGSSKGHNRKGKKQSNSGDVWERIRNGLRIPRPSPVSAGFDPIPIPIGLNLQPTLPINPALKATTAIAKDVPPSTRLTTVISGKKQLLAKSPIIEKYTGLGKKLFNPKGEQLLANKKLAGRLRGSTPSGYALPQPNDSFKSPTLYRIRTKLGFHPELSRQVDTSLAGMATKSAVLSKTENTAASNAPQAIAIKKCSDLNKKTATGSGTGLMSDQYSQLAGQCRIKQEVIFQRVNRQIANFTQKGGFLSQSAERARPYLYHIVDALNKHGLPLDLALLPIVESAYQATALSPAAAAGIWQFIPSTGRDYGLEQNDEYDARLDPSAATHAAIRFLGGLKDRYHGDWLLALAAYNCGPGAVDAAIARNQAEGLDTDYWSLSLPTETQDYVPRLLAVASIFANPGGYGLKLRPVRNEPYFIKVNIDRDEDIDHLLEKDLGTIAKLADFGADDFAALNAAYLKPTLTEHKPYSFLMPINHANELHRSLAFLTLANKTQPVQPASVEQALLPEFLTSWPKIQSPLLSIAIAENKPSLLAAKPDALPEAQSNLVTHDPEKPQLPATDYLAVHYLDKGESLKSLAEHHGITEALLRQVNKFKRRQSVGLGQRLLIPVKQGGWL